MTGLVRLAGLAVLTLSVTGHVGTDDVFFAGAAGPWHVRVSVRQPGVIPGLADITVRVADAGVSRVRVTARATGEGGGSPPPPDEARPVRGETGLYSAQLWLMVRGSHEVVVMVDGEAGSGVVGIPVIARATKQLEMTLGLELFVLGGGLFLVVGLLTIVGASVRESVLPAGVSPGAKDRAKARRAVVVAGLALALTLFGGFRWIQAEAAAHRARIDRPWSAEATTRATTGGWALDFAITDPLWVNRNDEAWRARNRRYRRADLIPDHGKMMHMFVIREPALDAFAHIHPERVNENEFSVALPPLPEGQYRVYADIAHEDGYSQTLQAAVAVRADDGAGAGSASGGSDIDVDDAWWTGGTAGVRSELGGGLVMEWLNGDTPLIAGEDGELQFRVIGSDGEEAVLDPYMGMAGHAMLNRADGGVFIHLHPAGMISMAAQSAVGSQRAPGSASEMSSGMDMGNAADGTSGSVVRFPLIVPPAGRYRIWIQVRQGESVMTGAFDTEVLTR